MKKIHYTEFEELSIYEWCCPDCGHYNKQDEVENINLCNRCDESFYLDEEDY